MSRCIALKSLQVQHVPTHIRLSSAQYNKNGSIYNTTKHWIMLSSTGEGNAGKVSLNTFRSSFYWNFLDWLYQIPQRWITKQVKMFAAISLVHWKMRQPLRQLSIPKPWQQQKQQSEHPKIACMNGSSSASQIQYQQQPNAPFSEAKKQASGCKPHQVTSMERASLKWNSEMHCIFDIVEHHPISPHIAMAVALNSP